MNKKKCPKCGEENPADAAMCWACYTPLSDAAIASGAAAGTTTSAISGGIDLEEEEKEKTPVWQLAVIGAGLLMAVGFGVYSLMPSGNTGGGDFDDLPMDPPIAQDAPQPTQSSPVTFSSSGTASVTPTEAPFSIVISPNPKYSTGTMAILPKDNNVSGAMAASYAAYVRRQYAGQMKRWSTFYVYVFSDPAQAQEFSKLMRQRRGAPLGESEYRSLTPIWRAAVARYEYSAVNDRRVERVLYPSQNPNGWWNGR